MPHLESLSDELGGAVKVEAQYRGQPDDGRKLGIRVPTMMIFRTAS
jgi:hypothetical protein